MRRSNSGSVSFDGIEDIISSGIIVKRVGYTKPYTNVCECEKLYSVLKDENIGKKTNGDGIINGISVPSLTLVKSEANGIVTLTPKLDIRDSEDYDYEYSWFFSDDPLSEWTGKGVSLKNNALVIDTSKLGKDTYQIYCMVSITQSSTAYKFVTVDAQYSLILY